MIPTNDRDARSARIRSAWLPTFGLLIAAALAALGGKEPAFYVAAVFGAAATVLALAVVRPAARLRRSALLVAAVALAGAVWWLATDPAVAAVWTWLWAGRGGSEVTVVRLVRLVQGACAGVAVAVGVWASTVGTRRG